MLRFGTRKPARLEVVGRLDQQRDVGRIVERAIVKIVAIDRRAESIAVQVRGDDDELVFQLRIAARELGDNIGRTDVALRHVHLDAQACWEFRSSAAAASRRPT